jgi:hypothetical protein
MKVFWSWQDDYQPKTCRHFVRDALAEAIKGAGEELGLEDSDRPEIDHDTKGTPGMTEIAKTILDKISRSAVFVADLTPISKTTDGKALPNPNVLIELGWALSELGPDRIIPVLNTASGYKPDDLPFDIRHRRAMTYELADTADAETKKKAKKALIKELTDALRTNLGHYVEEQTASKSIEGVAAQTDDPSIWGTASAYLDHNDAFGHGQKNTAALPKCPRGYIRIIPSGWKRGSPPSVHDIATNSLELTPQSEGTSSGDFGACKEGFVRYWITGQTVDGGRETRNVAMYFDETGEFWVLHGKAIDQRKFGLTLNIASLIDGWSKAIRTALGIYKGFHNLPGVRIEAGLFGVEGVRWPGQFDYNSPPSRKGRCVFSSQQRDWSCEAQMHFLTGAYNGVRDLYGFPRATGDDVAIFIK